MLYEPSLQMNETHSLTLNEEAFRAFPDEKKPAFVFEWLRYLDRILPVTHKSDLKSVHKRLLQQLEGRIQCTDSPATRQLLARCLAKVHSADSSSLFGTINLCNDILKVKDDSPSHTASKLTSITCLSALYESMGRLVGRTYEESYSLMNKWMKTAESQGRCEILNTLRCMVMGLGSAAGTMHKEIYKTARTHASDRVLSVRISAIRCLASLVPVFPYMYVNDWEQLCTSCVKALEASNYEVRMECAKLIAIMLATVLDQPKTLGAKPTTTEHVRTFTLDNIFQFLSTAFLRGGAAGGFLTGGGFLKGNANTGSKEVRMGIAMAYVEFAKEMGTVWLERTTSEFCKHIMELGAKCGGAAYDSNSIYSPDCVFMRKCLSYVLRSVFGRMLSEQAQISVCKQLGQLLSGYINSFDYTIEVGIEASLDHDVCASATAAAIALLEISALVRQIGTAVTPLFTEASGIMESIFAYLIHPVLGTRIATAWCLRCVTLAVPSQLTPLIDRCINRLEHMKASAEAISGYSIALSALIAASADCKLGIPLGKPKKVCDIAEDFLKKANQQCTLAVSKINAGWILIFALVSLGANHMRSLMPRISNLWRCVFPRSVKEAEEEFKRGDGFTWQSYLESRAGALAVMAAVAAQKDLVDDEMLKGMILPVECCLQQMNRVGYLIKSFGPKLRQPMSLLRLRVYNLILLLPVKSYEKIYSVVFRELVADLSLSDNPNSTQMTGCSAQLSSGPERVLLNPYFNATDQSAAENFLQSANMSVGAIEHDPTAIISSSPVKLRDSWPEPEPVPCACVDAAVHVYSKVFYIISAKNKIQIIKHYEKMFKESKSTPRLHVIQHNVICAMAGAFRNVADQRSKIDDPELRKISLQILLGGLSCTNAHTRCVAAEGIGRLAQAVGDPEFVVEVAQICFNRVNREPASSKAGYALALGSLHRHVGTLGSAHHQKTGLSILLALPNDTKTAPTVQAWAVVSLALIAETGEIRPYVEMILSVCLKVLLSSSNSEVILCIGKLISALMTCVATDLNCPGTIESIRSALLASCAIQMAHPDPLVRAEAIAGFQQMHLYAPRQVNLCHLVIDIASSLSSYHLCVRKAAVCCLRQLVQREAKEVREHVQVLVPQGVVDEGKKLPLPDTGLEGALFGMLDIEADLELRSHIQESLISLVLATSGELLSHWLSLCKDILASSSENTKSTLVVEDKFDNNDDDDDEGGDDDANLQGVQSNVPDKGKVLPRWPTRVFAMEIVQRLLSVCDTERAHLDLALAKELQLSSSGRCDYLVLHISDLVRMAFMGATSENTELRLAGLETLQDIINRFSTVPEPEFPGHVILEQFQAQVGAALRPAFSEDTPSHVTAAACQVCSTWIGSGVARDLNDLRRVHQLLLSSLKKLEDGSINTQLYSESAATLEKLSILKAWAEVYVTALEREAETKTADDDELSRPLESLLSLVRPKMETLIGYWLSALHDAAIVTLPPKYEEQCSLKLCAFYTHESIEVVRGYYRSSWPSILLATSLWMKENNSPGPMTSTAPSVWPNDNPQTRFSILVGIAVETLCNKTSYVDDLTAQACIKALIAVLSSEWCQMLLMADVQQAVEIANVLHRVILTRDSTVTQQLCINCAHIVLDAALTAIRISTSSDVENGNVEIPVDFTLYSGKDGEEGNLNGTLSFALLELCLCVFVRQMPQINSAKMKSRSLAPLHIRKCGRLPPEGTNLVRSTIQLLVQISQLCSAESRLLVLPIIMYLLVAFVRESARIDENYVVPDLPPGHLSIIATASLQGLRVLASTPPTDGTLSSWLSIIRSALYSLLKLCDGDARYDRCVILLSCVVMAQAAPKSVVLGHSESFHRLVRLMREQLQSDHPKVVCKALQSLSSIFFRKEINASFIKNLGEDVFNVLKPFVVGQQSYKMISDVTEEQVAMLQEAEKVIESLAHVANERKRPPIVSLLTQSLCRLLLPTAAEEWRQMSPAARKLHDFAIARLNIVAPTWPLEFKSILTAHPDLKKRLEGALMFQASRNAMALQTARAKQIENKTTIAAPQPTIKLKMDFNAFEKA